MFSWGVIRLGGKTTIFAAAGNSRAGQFLDIFAHDFAPKHAVSRKQPELPPYKNEREAFLPPHRNILLHFRDGKPDFTGIF
jgi:hypothetical protein